MQIKLLTHVIDLFIKRVYAGQVTIHKLTVFHSIAEANQVCAFKVAIMTILSPTVRA